MGRKEWTTVEPNSENKLVRVSAGHFPRLLFKAKIKVLGWFVN
jgi:hypothetical protein